LDDLVNLLSGPKGQGVIERNQNSTPGAVSHTSPTPIHQPQRASSSFEANPGRRPRLRSPQHDTGSSSISASHHPSQRAGSHFHLPNQEGAFLLLEFRTSMAHQFPFVVIPPEATSESLRTERPMLWKAVLTAASCLNPSRQEAMGRELVEELSTRLLLKAEKSLDLLQALIIHIAWLVSL
jgi:hypothetical protein